MRPFVPLVATLCLPLAAMAQAVSGHVVTTTSAAVPGAIVTLLDSAGTPLARALTGEGGRFNMRMPHAGRFRFEVQRIGYASRLDAPFRLDSGEVAGRAIVAGEVPVSLAALHADDARSCAGSDSGAAPFVVWGEVRKALLASQLTRQTRAYTMDVALFSNRQPADKRLRAVEQRDERFQSPLRALTSVTPEQLAADGYLIRSGAGDRYFAPDENVLLSPSFAATHCLRLLAPDAGSGTVRLAFVPAVDRRQPEIRGVIAVDAATAELRRIDFWYVNLRATEQTGDPGGEIDFVRLPEGSWIIDYWALALPFTEQVVQRASITVPATRAGSRPTVIPALTTVGTGRLTVGGGVTRIQFGDVVVWKADGTPSPHDPAPLPP